MKKTIRVILVLAVVLSTLVLSTPAQAADDVIWKQTADCSQGYTQTGKNVTDAVGIGVFPGQLGVIIAGQIDGRGGPVFEILEPGGYARVVSEGGICVGEANRVRLWARANCPSCVDVAMVVPAPPPVPEQVAPPPIDPDQISGVQSYYDPNVRQWVTEILYGSGYKVWVNPRDSKFRAADGQIFWEQDENVVASFLAVGGLEYGPSDWVGQHNAQVQVGAAGVGGVATSTVPCPAGTQKVQQNPDTFGVTGPALVELWRPGMPLFRTVVPFGKSAVFRSLAGSRWEYWSGANNGSGCSTASLESEAKTSGLPFRPLDELVSAKLVTLR